MQSNVDILVTGDFDEVREAWISMLSDGRATPYQHIAWLEAWAKSHPNEEPLLTLVSAKSSKKPIMLLPLSKRRKAGINLCTFLAEKVQNTAAPILGADSAGRIAEQDISAIVTALNTAHPDLDLVAFRNLPITIQGRHNPLIADPFQLASNPNFRLDLQPNFKQLAASRRSKSSMSLLRRKRRKLSEVGAISFNYCSDSDSCMSALDAFLKQKSNRFAAQGISDIFAEPQMADFLQRITSDCTGQMNRFPTANETARVSDQVANFSWHTLTLDGEILATFGGIFFDGHFSCFVNSIDDQSRHVQRSPGDLLLMELLETLCENNFGSLDLGRGAERYKQAWCDVEPLFDVYRPVSHLGQIAANVHITSTSVKRQIRGSKTLWPLYRRIRKIVKKT